MPVKGVDLKIGQVISTYYECEQCMMWCRDDIIRAEIEAIVRDARWWPGMVRRIVTYDKLSPASTPTESHFKMALEGVRVFPVVLQPPRTKQQYKQRRQEVGRYAEQVSSRLRARTLTVRLCHPRHPGRSSSIMVYLSIGMHSKEEAVGESAAKVRMVLEDKSWSLCKI